MKNEKYSPVLKWAGGKSKISEIIVDYMPKNYGNYYEPFFGGGAIGMKIYDEERKFNLSDINSDLIKFYEEIKNNYSQVIENLRNMKEIFNISENKESLFNEYKKEFNISRDASLFYFLNKTGFNGLVRYNSKNEYNIPYGKRDFNYDEEKLLKLSEYFNKENIFVNNCDFRNISPQENDLIYLDPPYHPLSTTSSFTAYCGKWTEKDEVEMAEKCQMWNENGIYFMLSNNNVDFIRNLFKGFNIVELSVTKSVGASKETRKKTSEVLIFN